jgi:response regulator RpfG family c-di-GMP phosphodiesterase
MSDKKRRAVTLDEENDDFLADQHNASALVNDLVTEYRKGEDKSTVALELQLKQKRKELREARKRAERLEGDVEELEQLKDEFTEQETAELHEARDALQGTPMEPTNEAVKTQAEKVGLTPTELIERLE